MKTDDTADVIERLMRFVVEPECSCRPLAAEACSTTTVVPNSQNDCTRTVCVRNTTRQQQMCDVNCYLSISLFSRSVGRRTRTLLAAAAAGAACGNTPAPALARHSINSKRHRRSLSNANSNKRTRGFDYATSNTTKHAPVSRSVLRDNVPNTAAYRERNLLCLFFVVVRYTTRGSYRFLLFAHRIDHLYS